MGTTESVRYNHARLSELTAGRMVRAIARYGRLPLTHPFHRHMFWLDRTAEDGALAQLRGYEEMDQSAWKGLEQFGYALVRRLQPRVIVELGTHMGLSALAMALGLKKNGQGGRLFAVDSWQGEEHAGFYQESVYDTFLRRREDLDLTAEVVPLRMFFDEAVDKVARPIDLLHIDGLHTMEAVTHDWKTFGPLVRPGGIVIFHDVRSQWKDVGDFWASLQERFRTHTLEYSNGLGVLQIPRWKSITF